MKTHTESQPRILLMGDSAVEIEFGSRIDPAVNRRVLAAKRKIDAAGGIIETVPTYCTLVVHYDPLRLTFSELKDQLQALLEDMEEEQVQETGRLVRIPVCYGGAFGPDLEFVAKSHGLTPEEVIRIHSEPEYRVYMLGFIAGFPYLGGMDERLETPRLETPRVQIPGGSVGIAGKQTGIYPVASPGGWQLIGRTPLKLYDGSRDPVTLLQAGDRLRFCPVTEQEFDRIEKEGLWEL